MKKGGKKCRIKSRERKKEKERRKEREKVKLKRDTIHYTDRRFSKGGPPVVNVRTRSNSWEGLHSLV